MADKVAKKSVTMAAPARSLKSKVIRQALEMFVAPDVLKHCHVAAIRCIFNVADKEDIVKQQLAARKRKLEMTLLENREVRLFVDL